VAAPLKNSGGSPLLGEDDREGERENEGIGVDYGSSVELYGGGYSERRGRYRLHGGGTGRDSLAVL
jgi:hypothetical protein